MDRLVRVYAVNLPRAKDLPDGIYDSSAATLFHLFAEGRSTSAHMTPGIPG